MRSGDSSREEKVLLQTPLHSPGAVNTSQRKEPTREAADLSPDPELLWPE